MTKNNTNPGTAIERRPSNAPARQECAPQNKMSAAVYRPALDLYDFDDRYEVRVDLPGTTADQIDVTLNESVLTIEARVPHRYEDGITPLHGEYGVGDFRRQIRLGEDVDADKLGASYELGVLTLDLPKLAERRPRRIEVKGG